jgi:hypothetical protein
MVEIEKQLFSKMIEYINGLGTFYSDAVPQRKLGKVSDIRSALSESSESSMHFLNHLQTHSSASIAALSKFKTPLKKLVNILGDIERGLETGTIKNKTQFRKEVGTSVKPLLDVLAKLAEGFAPGGMTEEELQKELKFLSQQKGHKVALNVLRKSAKQAAEPDGEDDDSKKQRERSASIDKEAEKLLSGYSKLKSKLPTTLRGKLFTLVEMPIVPYVNFAIMSPAFLRTTGVEFSYLAESFPVLEKQHLLAFDYVAATTGADGARKDISLKSDKTNLKARKRDAAHLSMQEKFIIDIIEAINTRSSEHYTLMTSHFEHHPNNGRIAFAWIAPRRLYRQFANKAGMDKANWGFPWSKDTAALL